MLKVKMLRFFVSPCTIRCIASLRMTNRRFSI